MNPDDETDLQENAIMTLQEKVREAEALELDWESVCTLVSELDTQRLHMLAEAAMNELTDRYEGKPVDRSRFH